MAEQTSSSAVGKVVDVLFDVAKKEISYICNSTNNIENLKTEVENLKVMRGKVQQQIITAKRKGDDLLYGVQEWVDKADIKISNAEGFLEQQADAKKAKLGMFGNLSTIYRYRKGAINMTPNLLQHQQYGKTFESCVSVDTSAPGRLDVYQNKNLNDLFTHNSALEDIIKAVEDESKQIIGIYGVGGVGKTTLAMEVVKRVKDMFAVVAFTTVSQTVDSNKILKDIGEATKRIMKGEKVLIILDDVWQELDLEELCIPCGLNYMNCKILLTSRNEDVCETMNVQGKICVNCLPIEEAWILFKQVVGDKVETDFNLKPVALEVAKECGGLPLLIQTIGKALKNRDVNSWKKGLNQLQKNAPADIAPSIRRAFTRLKLSYDYLENEEVQWCFLMCSMFPEDWDISVEELVHYGVGSAKFNELDSMEDARNRVQNAVNILKSSGLLLNRDALWSDNLKQYVKMHDVVRDVALLIGKRKFLVKANKGLTEWLPRNNISESYTGISLMHNKICKIPEYEIHFPNLEILLLQSNKLPLISEEFFKGMKEARVLNMACNHISSLPQSLKLLTKLRMLDLQGNDSLVEISILGELKDLEVLILNNTRIKEIPQEIDQLVNLRRLEVIECHDLSYIAQGVISKLWRLEELRIELTWMRERVYDCIFEVMSLTKLTYLELKATSFDVIPEGFNSGKLKRFLIQIGGNFGFIPGPHSTLSSESYLVIDNDHLQIPFVKWIKELIKVCPNTRLERIENLKNILPNLYHEGFNKISYIQLLNCPNVSCLVDTNDWDQGETKDKFLVELKHLKLYSLYNLEVLWNCPDQYISLTNLVNLQIYRCQKLVRLFPVSVAQGLVKLKELSIKCCDGLKEVIWGETEMVKHAANIIVFSCLTKIELNGLDGLKSFCCANCAIKYPSLVYVTVRGCFNMKIWGPGTHETPKLKFVNDVPILDGPYAINDAVAKVLEEW